MKRRGGRGLCRGAAGDPPVPVLLFPFVKRTFCADMTSAHVDQEIIGVGDRIRQVCNAQLAPAIEFREPPRLLDKLWRPQ